MRSNKIILSTILALGSFAAWTRAEELSLPAVVSDHMVLQRGMKVPIWGWAAPNEKVTVKLCGQEVSAVADDKGKWALKLEPLEAGGPFEMAVAGAAKAVTLKDVLVGEVWFCSGQSNMATRVEGAMDGPKETAEANYPKIRHFNVGGAISLAPQHRCGGSWAVCSPQTAGKFTAVGYFFAREILKETNVPVGLIHTSAGGAYLEPFMSREGFLAEPSLKYFVERMDVALGRLGQKMDMQHPAVWYNGMIHPVAPYSVRGALWYQGESNRRRAVQYETLLRALVQDWRRCWGQEKYFFLIVQLSTDGGKAAQPRDDQTAELRESQMRAALALSDTGIAMTGDIGGKEGDVHPSNKQEVGRRLALWALANVYGKKDLVFSGPVYEKCEIEGDKIRCRFKHTSGGLIFKGDGKPTGFAIAGEDKKFVWGDAVIDGDSVVVSSDKVAKPASVRYAWESYPTCSLYNKEGLPAFPFRTDDWQLTSAKERIEPGWMRGLKFDDVGGK